MVLYHCAILVGAVIVYVCVPYVSMWVPLGQYTQLSRRHADSVLSWAERAETELRAAKPSSIARVPGELGYMDL